MGPVQKKVEDATDSALLRADGELLAAVLDVHRQLELKGQLRALLDHALAWTGGDCGFGLGPGEENDKPSVLTSTLDAGDPRIDSIEGAGPAELDRLLAADARVLDGLGPLGEIAGPWPGETPECCVGHRLAADGEEAAAAIWVLLAEGRPAARELERLGHLVRLAAPAIGNAFRVRGMRELVIKDDTAHCFNRRYFESNLPDELARAGRFGAPLSLIFLDMDNLKEVNTLHGHAMGSQTLREVSYRILAKIRRFDKLFRFGGDEFCIVLPETEWHGALEVAERVRDAIANKPFLVRELPEVGGRRMTASLGIASFPLHARDRKELIHQADRAMQRIKSGSKNSIGIAEIIGGDHGE